MAKENFAMFGTQEGDWDRVPLSFANKMVAERKWYACQECNSNGIYDDELPSFHAVSDEHEQYDITSF